MYLISNGKKEEIFYFEEIFNYYSFCWDGLKENEPHNIEALKIYKEFDTSIMPFVDETYDENDEDFSISFKEYVKDAYDYPLPDDVLEAAATAVARDYVVNALFSSRQEEPDDLFITLNDLMNITEKCNGDLTPKTARDLASKFNNSMRCYSDFKSVDGKYLKAKSSKKIDKVKHSGKTVKL